MVTRHRETYASELWLFEDEKAVLIKILRQHLNLRRIDGDEPLDIYWKAVRKSFKKEAGYNLWWLDGRNEVQDARAAGWWGIASRFPLAARQKMLLGKRKRGQNDDDLLPPVVVGAAFTNTYLSNPDKNGDLDPHFRHGSPPPYDLSSEPDSDDDEDSTDEGQESEYVDDNLCHGLRSTPPTSVSSVTDQTSTGPTSSNNEISSAHPSSTPRDQYFTEDFNIRAINALGMAATGKHTIEAAAAAHSIPVAPILAAWEHRKAYRPVEVKRLTNEQGHKL
jgi:hypothetical protein